MFVNPLGFSIYLHNCCLNCYYISLKRTKYNKWDKILYLVIYILDIMIQHCIAVSGYSMSTSMIGSETSVMRFQSLWWQSSAGHGALLTSKSKARESPQTIKAPHVKSTQLKGSSTSTLNYNAVHGRVTRRTLGAFIIRLKSCAHAGRLLGGGGMNGWDQNRTFYFK